ncbi:MAG TPA: c-type cytochrome biogenesis protein CcsB [Dermatophilaceae bacterium]|nr:c-type cytochrome biogenesis protein CcsB [Dermatophilaceae bacterium]
MLTVSQLLVAVGAFLVLIAFTATVVSLVTARRVPVRPAARAVLVGAGGPAVSEDAPLGMPQTVPVRSWYARVTTWLALLALTGALVARGIAVGHGPFANQYEFAVALAWGLLAAYGYAAWRDVAGGADALGLVVLPITLAALLYATTTGGSAGPLVPALQHHLLLTVHVFSAVVAYGAAGVACAAAVLQLLPRRPSWLPSERVLDQLAYRSVAVAFPLLTVMLVLGSVWAERAWGTFWSWDPKETAALVTWLIYGAYLHARVVRGWRGQRASWLLVAGFAAVLFTYLGNHFLGGLHSYA